MADPLSITASAVSVAHVLKKLYDIGDAAFKSKKEKRAFNDTINNLFVQIESLKRLEERALRNKDDPRYAGFRALLKSSQQFQNGSDVKPDPSGTAPGILQRLLEAMERMETKLEVKHGFRAGARRLLWFQEKDEFKETIAEIKQWTDVVDSVLRYDHQLMAVDTDEHVKDTNTRVKNLEEEAARAAEDRKLAAEERKQVALREEKKVAEKALRLREARRLEIVRWISPLKFGERHSAILNQAPSGVRNPDLLQSEEFDLWRRGQPWVLYCEGKPGAGKTLLCALVGENLKDQSERDATNVPILFMYLNHKERDAQSLSNLFASLLKQFLQLPGSSLQSDEAQSLYQGPVGERRPGWKDFHRAFCAEVMFYEKVFLIVDALDEASLDVAPQLLDGLYKLPNDHVSVMVTSQRTEDTPPPTLQVECNHCGRRPLQAYYQCLVCNNGSFFLCHGCEEAGLYCNVDSHELTQPRTVLMSIDPTNEEIRDYVQAEFQAERELGGLDEGANYPSTFGTTPLGRLCMEKPWLQEEISNAIVAKADGMFALAQLYLSSFRSLGLTEPEIIEMLEEPPQGYTALYEQHMERISEEGLGRVGSNVGMGALLWVACVSRPLRFSELQDALAVNLRKSGFFNPSARRDKATIVRATAGLITIDMNDQATVRLTHSTAQQYFDKNRDRWFPDAPALIARVSLHYLSLKRLASPGEGEWEDKEFEMRGLDYPFLEYAYQYWGDHARDAAHNPASQGAVMQFVSDEYRIAAATQALWYLNSETDVDWDVRKGANALHICAWFGLTDAISSLLGQGIDIDSKDPKHAQTPLMYACRRGQAAAVALLLDRGARLDVMSSRGNSALYEAVFAGRLEVLKVLLAHPDLDVNETHPGRSNQTALMFAAQEGKWNIIDSLLEQDALDVNLQDANRNTALCLAILSDKTKIAVQMIEYEGKSFQLNLVNWTGSSALILAASQGQVEVVDKLLDKGADPSIRDEEGGGTALLRAVDSKSVRVVEIMLKHENVNVHALDDDDRGLLHGAALSGCAEILELLLDQGLDFNAKDKKGKTPLHDASQAGAFDVTKLLLDRGANTSLQDHAQRTAWTIAWQQGHKELMKVLEGKDPYELSEQDLSDEYPDADALPVWALANLGFLDHVSKALVVRPRELYYLNPDDDDTALHCAVASEQLDIVEMLLKAGISADAKNNYHRTPLHLAALSGNVPIMSHLIASLSENDEAGAVNEPDKWGSSPLILAHSNGHTVCCLLLIEAGAVISASQATMKQTLYFSAIGNGRLEAVQRLVHMGADIQIKNLLGLTGLQMAKEGGHADIEKFLRRSKSMKVPGLGLEIDGGLEDEGETSQGVFSGEMPIEASKALEQGRKADAMNTSPTVSLAERLQSLEIPGRNDDSDLVDEGQGQEGLVRPRRIPQLA